LSKSSPSDPEKEATANTSGENGSPTDPTDPVVVESEKTATVDSCGENESDCTERRARHDQTLGSDPPADCTSASEENGAQEEPDGAADGGSPPTMTWQDACSVNGAYASVTDVVERCNAALLQGGPIAPELVCEFQTALSRLSTLDAGGRSDGDILATLVEDALAEGDDQAAAVLAGVHPDPLGFMPRHRVGARPPDVQRATQEITGDRKRLYPYPQVALLAADGKQYFILLKCFRRLLQAAYTSDRGKRSTFLRAVHEVNSLALDGGKLHLLFHILIAFWRTYGPSEIDRIAAHLGRFGFQAKCN
jgi:hypothetical protein